MRPEYARNWRDAIGEDGIRLPRDLVGRGRRAVRSAAISVLAAGSRVHVGPFLRCVYCHYVFDDQVHRFREALTAFSGMGRFVDTDTCLAMVRGEVPIDDRYYHLSFDDGFKNVLENAAPVLQMLGIPALLLVPSALIGTHWGRVEMLTWRDLAELRSLGITIGSHSRTHPRLSDLTHSDLVEEVCRSKEEIESRLGVPCEYFSWPFGGREDLGAGATDLLREAGYAGSFGAFRGTVRAGVTSPFRIPRHHFEPEWPLSHVKFFAGGRWEVEK